MRLSTLGASLLAAIAALLSAPTLAADNQAGVPLSPGDAAGTWTIEADGHSVCTLQLGADKSVKAASACGPVLSAAPTAWAPTNDGMKLVGSGGQTVLGFGRWSNSLFVAHRSSGTDVQLRRGVPGSPRSDPNNPAGTPAKPAPPAHT
jgi:hypothetical protein